MNAKKREPEPLRMWETYNPKTGEYREGSSGGSGCGCPAMMLTFGLYASLVLITAKKITKRGERL